VHVLDAARQKTKRDVERLVASLRPQPPVPTIVRKLPALSKRVEGPAPSEAVAVPVEAESPKALKANAPMDEERLPTLTSTAPSTATEAQSRRAVVQPLAPEIYKIQFTMSRDMHDRLRRAQDLLRHTIPNGEPGAIFDRALTLLLKEHEKTKC